MPSKCSQIQGGVCRPITTLGAYLGCNCACPIVSPTGNLNYIDLNEGVLVYGLTPWPYSGFAPLVANPNWSASFPEKVYLVKTDVYSWNGTSRSQVVTHVKTDYFHQTSVGGGFAYSLDSTPTAVLSNPGTDLTMISDVVNPYCANPGNWWSPWPENDPNWPLQPTPWDCALGNENIVSTATETEAVYSYDVYAYKGHYVGERYPEFVESHDRTFVGHYEHVTTLSVLHLWTEAIAESIDIVGTFDVGTIPPPVFNVSHPYGNSFTEVVCNWYPESQHYLAKIQDGSVIDVTSAVTPQSFGYDSRYPGNLLLAANGYWVGSVGLAGAAGFISAMSFRVDFHEGNPWVSSPPPSHYGPPAISGFTNINIFYKQVPNLPIPPQSSQANSTTGNPFRVESDWLSETTYTPNDVPGIGILTTYLVT